MPELPPIVQALLDPKAYPLAPPKIEMAQTQMSFVFLAGDYVYKMKKPVDLGYLDYTTLEKRYFYCQREVELNRRLCPDTYLGVVPITQNKDVISLEGKGEVIEYVVKMRRLPQKAMMNILLAGNQVSKDMITGVAQRLTEFHQRAETDDAISAFGDLDTITTNTEENFSQTIKYIGQTLSQKKYRQINDYTRGFIENNTVLFRKRMADDKIRDCHGDLHAAHICFTNGICIYDCIEFNDRFRYGDVASEIAFLAMDLDHYGRADLSREFIDAYVGFSRDKELIKLLNFYKCYRAYVRGKVESFKLDDPHILEDEKGQIRQVAGSYFDLAHSYTRTKPLLLITVGLVGTGKSVLAQALARRLGLVLISSDVTRKRLASIPLTEHRFEDFGRGIYSAESSRLTYDEMLDEGRDILGKGGSVILDAAFLKVEERQKARKIAEETKAGFFILECVLDEDLIKQRLERRLKEGSVSDGRWEIYEPQKKRFEPITEVPETNHVIIDTKPPVEEAVRKALEKIEVMK
jgi:aminoglycoside phosphotransferase family enzyme/adenylate kinase family enzyme